MRNSALIAVCVAARARGCGPSGQSCVLATHLPSGGVVVPGPRGFLLPPASGLANTAVALYYYYYYYYCYYYYASCKTEAHAVEGMKLRCWMS